MNQTVSPGPRTGSVRIPASKSQAHRRRLPRATAVSVATAATVVAVATVAVTVAAIVAVTVVATTIISKSDLFKAKQQCYSRKRPNLGECRKVA